MDKNAKLEELFKSESFKKEAEGVKTAEEMQTLFARHGVEYSIDEVYALCEVIAKKMERKDGSEELSEETLEDVAGGFAITAGLVVLGISCIGAAALGIYNGYKAARK